MAEIKTVTSLATETEISFGDYYQFVWVRNAGEGDCYVSAKSGITAGGADVASVKAGETALVITETNTIYSKGATTLECHAQNFAECPFKRAAKGGESSITVESITITNNGTTTAPTGKAYTPITVNVQPNVGAKNITANGTYTASADNLDGYSSVTVNVSDAPTLPDTYTRLDYVECGGASAPAYFDCTYTENKSDLWEFVTSANALDSGYHTFYAVSDAYSLAYDGDTLKGWQITPFSGNVSADVDTAYRAIITTGTDTASKTFAVGAYHGTNWTEFFDGKIYSIKCKRTDADGEKTLFDNLNYALYFIPAKRNSDDVIGLYEAVSGTFYTSTSGNAFTGA